MEFKRLEIKGSPEEPLEVRERIEDIMDLIEDCDEEIKQDVKRNLEAISACYLAWLKLVPGWTQDFLQDELEEVTW